MESVDPKDEMRELSDDELEGVEGGCGNTAPTGLSPNSANGAGSSSLANGANANNFNPGAYGTGS